MTRELILGVPVHAIPLADAEEEIARWIANRRIPPGIVVHTNAFSLVTAQEDASYKKALQTVDLSVPDGMPVVWLLRKAGLGGSERVYGPDLMERLCRRAAREGWRCYLFGGNPGVPELVRDALCKRFPTLRIVGTYAPPFRSFTEEEDEAIINAINAEKPDIIWVALGGPKQDLWMTDHRHRINASVMHGVGAAFDFLAGRVPQAPRWMMSAGLEWLFRLLAEPQRLWQRYTVKNAKFLYFVLTRQLLPLRRGRPSPSGE